MTHLCDTCKHREEEYKPEDMQLDHLDNVVECFWYKADAGDVCGAKADKYFRRIDAQHRLEQAARDLIEEGGKAEVTE